MKNLFQYIIAAILVTISLYLISFEKGQDLIRGLVGLEALVLLLFWRHFYPAKIWWQKIGLGVSSLLLVALVALDWHTLVALKGEGLWSYLVIPLAVTLLALFLVKAARPVPSINAIVFLFFILILHLIGMRFYAAQPLLVFPTFNYIGKSHYTESFNRDSLTAEWRSSYKVVDTTTITTTYLDTARINIIILVESWGVPLNKALLDSQIKYFDSTLTEKGVHRRLYSRTRTAEREDLAQSFSINPKTKIKDTLWIPAKWRRGIGTYYFTSDSLGFMDRASYIKTMGFEHIHFGKPNESDSAVALQIDSLLSIAEGPILIAWSTREGRQNGNYQASINKNLKAIATLACKYPQARFIVQGDHEPLLHKKNIVNAFYRRFVPYMILN